MALLHSNAQKGVPKIRQVCTVTLIQDSFASLAR